MEKEKKSLMLKRTKKKKFNNIINTLFEVYILKTFTLQERSDRDPEGIRIRKSRWLTMSPPNETALLVT